LGTNLGDDIFLERMMREAQFLGRPLLVSVTVLECMPEVD
jgi:hypothetical protein